MTTRARPQLLLHIGMNKTGTTAMQLALAANRRTLRDNGVLYPGDGYAGEAHHELAWLCGFYQGKPPHLKDAFETYCDRLHREVEASKCSHVLVSSEFFSLPGLIEPVVKAFERYDTRVVVYLRRHDHWWQSVYVQAVKTVENPPWGRNYSGYLNAQARQRSSMIGRYRWLVDRWAEAFGADRMIVRPYERSQNGPNLLFDLLRSAGLDAVTAKLPPELPRENSSISFATLSFIDIVQRTRLPTKVKRHLVDTAMARNGAETLPGALASPKVRLSQITANADDYQHIARTYMNRPDGHMFDEPLPDADDPWDEPKGPLPVELMERMAEYLTAADIALIELVRTQAGNRAAREEEAAAAAAKPARGGR